MLRLLKEPLLQFVVLGTLLFCAYSLAGKKGAEQDKIVVSAANIANLADGFSRARLRSPTAGELQDLIDDYIMDEVLYREGKAAGLDRDDAVIRKRVRQKLEFLASDIALPEPTEEQLAAYLAANPERFKVGDRLSFRHVFLSNMRRQGITVNELTRMRTALTETASRDDAANIGDPFLLGEEFTAVSQSDVAQSFGDDFAKQLFEARERQWIGPVRSGYGAHFVLISNRVPGSLPPLSQVRRDVEREWTNERRLEAEQKFRRTLRDRYEIVVEPLGQDALQ